MAVSSCTYVYTHTPPKIWWSDVISMVYRLPMYARGRACGTNTILRIWGSGVRISSGAPIKPGDYSRLIGVNFAKVGEVIAVMHAKPYFGGSTRGSSCLAMSPAPESEM
jgi:hypothetical protein